jgi:hypothetical protein
MSPGVRSEMFLPIEAFATVTAGKWLFPSMNTNMSHKFRIRTKQLIAEGTFMCMPACKNFHSTCQISWIA